MKNMTLKRIKIENFMGIRDLEYHLGGDVRIFGDNATGKTTIKNAFLWLLFDKDCQNRADFAIKPRDASGAELHNLTTMVEADLDGLVLRKERSEKWTKRRGSSERVFEGHEIVYSIDGVPVKKGDYQERIAELADEKTFRILTDTTYFCETLHWQERRKTLAELTGASMGDMAAAEKDKERIKASLKKLNQEIDELPARIDEAKRSVMGDLPPLAKLEERIAQLDADKEALQQKRLEIKNGGATLALQQETQALKIKLQEIAGQRMTTRQQDRQKYQDAIHAAETAAAAERRKADDLAIKSKRIQMLLTQDNCDIEQLRKEYEKAADEEYVVGTTVCQTCGQQLPAERIEEARRRWNEQHAKDLDRLEARGKKLREQIDEQQATLEKLTDEIQAHGEVLQDADRRIREIKATEPKPTPETAEESEIKRKIDDLENKMKLEDSSKQALLQDLDKKMSEISGCRRDVAKQIAEHQAAAKTQQRIIELETRQAALGEEYAAAEQELMALEEAQKRMAQEVERLVNGHFETVTFALFKERINGGLEECCEPMVGGVPYGSANNAGRINAGLEIIALIGRHRGVLFPVFVDNREAVVNLYPFPGQTIELIVSGPDKTMRLEEK